MTPEEAHRQLCLELTVERYDQTWWHTPGTGAPDTTEARHERRLTLDLAHRQHDAQRDSRARPRRTA